MGCNSSKPSSGDKRNLARSSRRQNDNPPPYLPTAFDSRKALIENIRNRSQEEIEQFRYEIWVQKRSLESESGRAQLGMLQHILECIPTASSFMKIRCLDFVQDSGNQNTIRLLQLLEYQDRASLVQACENLADDVPHRAKIREAKVQAEGNSAITEATAVGLVQSAVLVALAVECKSWTLERFLEDWDDVKTMKEHIKAPNSMKLQAQISAQAEDAYINLSTMLGGVPTVYVNLVPSKTTATATSNIHSELQRVVKRITERASFTKKGKQDLVSFQFVVFAPDSKSGKWAKLDDMEKGTADIVDATVIIPTKFQTEGPGKDTLRKVLLGSVDAELDRKGSLQLYGMGWDADLPASK